MVSVALLILSMLRVFVEVAGMFLLGQGLLWILAGASRDRNPVYQLFRVITGPVLKTVRAIAPAVIVDRHIPLVTFALLFWLWIFLAYARVLVCDASGLSCR